MIILPYIYIYIFFINKAFDKTKLQTISNKSATFSSSIKHNKLHHDIKNFKLENQFQTGKEIKKERKKKMQ